MVLFNYSTRELTAKIVYYGPGICGKTTNLQFIHENLPGPIRGKMLSLATKTDRTLFFDFLPIDLGEIRGMKTRVQLYTVPGQVFYNETRKLVLKGVDGIVFVADSQETMLGANAESFKNLEDNLKGHGMKLADLPHVIQFNKRDLPKLSPIEEMNATLNKYNAPFYESVAVTGIGVQDTLKAIVKLVLLNLTRKYETKSAVEAAVAAAPQVAAASQAAAAAAAVASVATPPPAVSRPARRVAETAASVQAPEPRRQTIPLSPIEAPAAPRRAKATPPPEPRPPAPQPIETLSSFREEEIDGLVGEVEDVEPMVAAAPVEESTWMGADPAEGEVSFADEPTAYGSNVPMEDLLSTHEAAPAPAAGSEFQIDRGFDPEWTQPVEDRDHSEPVSFDPEPEPYVPQPMSFAAPPAPAPTATMEELVPIVPFPLPNSGGATDSAERDVRLTEVASDDDLFTDPSLEVAHLADGDTREIIVPVVLGEGVSARRFKLAVRIRFDAVE